MLHISRFNKMKLTAIALLATIAVAVPRNTIIPVRDAIVAGNSRIIGGSPAVKGQFPWQAINRFSGPLGSGFCGGALISYDWVLTAAHCTFSAYIFEIVLGILNSSFGNEPGKVVIQTSTAIVHEWYSSLTLNHDVAIIYLEIPVSFSDVIQPIILGSDDLDSGVSVTVSGWGITADGNTEVSSELNFVKLVTISNNACEAVYGDVIIINSTLCCSGEDLLSTCKGDSGGPLVQERVDGTVHVGIVSFVHIYGCSSGKPSGNVRTASYRDWIQNNMFH